MTPVELMARAIGMQDFGRLTALAYHLMQVSDILGDVVEFGCHKGKTAAFLKSITGRSLWVYDSFEGLPYTPSCSGPLQAGALRAEIQEVQTTFYESGQEVYKIKKGLFSSLVAHNLPPSIAFAHIDGDLYESITEALELVYGRLAKGAVCFIDDYGTGMSHFSGVDHAVADYMKDKPETIIVPYGQYGHKSPHCYFTKI